MNNKYKVTAGEGQTLTTVYIGNNQHEANGVFIFYRDSDVTREVCMYGGGELVARCNHIVQTETPDEVRRRLDDLRYNLICQREKAMDVSDIEAVEEIDDKIDAIDAVCDE